MREVNHFRNDFADEVYRHRFQQEAEKAKEEALEEKQEAAHGKSDKPTLEELIAEEEEVFKPRQHKYNPTERFAMLMLSCLMALVMILVLDVNGIHVVKIAKRTVRRVINPRKVMTHDPFKNADEDISNDVIVLYRND